MNIVKFFLKELFNYGKMFSLKNYIWDFLKVRKKYWLAPLIITILLLGSLIVVTQGSAVAPLIYSIF